MPSQIYHSDVPDAKEKSEDIRLFLFVEFTDVFVRAHSCGGYYQTTQGIIRLHGKLDVMRCCTHLRSRLSETRRLRPILNG